MAMLLEISRSLLLFKHRRKFIYIKIQEWKMEMNNQIMEPYLTATVAKRVARMALNIIGIFNLDEGMRNIS